MNAQKHVEINCHYARNKVMSALISTTHVASSHQLVQVFIVRISYDVLCTKMGIFELYAIDWGGVSEAFIGLPTYWGLLSLSLSLPLYMKSCALLGFLALTINNIISTSLNFKIKSSMISNFTSKHKCNHPFPLVRRHWVSWLLA